VRPPLPHQLRRGRWLAKLDAKLDFESNVTASLWWFDGTALVDTTTNITVYEWGLPAGGSLAAAAKVEVGFFPDGRWYTTNPTGTAEDYIALWEFTLNGDMTAGEAAADKITIGGADTGDDVTVKDPAGLFTRALDGATGIMAEVDGEYFAIECQSKAGWIKFSLNGVLSGGSASAAVTDYGGSQQDVQNPGTEVTVHDGAGLFTRAIGSCIGLAFYDAVDDEYVVVECQSKAGWIEFTLTADLGSSATCTQDDYGGSQQDVFDPTATTVFDPHGLFTAAVSGCKGVALYDAIEDQYNVVECQTKAGWIRFQLREDMGETTANLADADVTEYGGSQNDIYDPGSTVDVYDEAGNFPNAIDDARGDAIWDETEGRYRVVHCQQQALRLKAKVDEASGVASSDTTFDVDNLVVASPRPFDQLPATYVDANTNLTVDNLYNFDLDDDADVDIYYDGSSWVCVQGDCPT